MYCSHEQEENMVDNEDIEQGYETIKSVLTWDANVKISQWHYDVKESSYSIDFEIDDIQINLWFTLKNIGEEFRATSIQLCINNVCLSENSLEERELEKEELYKLIDDAILIGEKATRFKYFMREFLYTLDIGIDV